MLTATFNVGKEDVLALTLQDHAHSPTARRSKILGHAVIPCALVLISAWSAFRDPRYFKLVAPLLLIAIIWAVFYPRFHTWCLQRTIEKILKESSYQKVFGNYTVTFSENGIASSSPVGAGTFLWPAVSRVSLTPNHLFIYLAGAQGIPIARAQVQEATILEIRAFAERMSHQADPGASPNGGPSTPPGNSEVKKAPLSMS